MAKSMEFDTGLSDADLGVLVEPFSALSLSNRKSQRDAVPTTMEFDTGLTDADLEMLADPPVATCESKQPARALAEHPLPLVHVSDNTVTVVPGTVHTRPFSRLQRAELVRELWGLYTASPWHCEPWSLIGVTAIPVARLDITHLPRQIVARVALQDHGHGIPACLLVFVYLADPDPARRDDWITQVELFGAYDFNLFTDNFVAKDGLISRRRSRTTIQLPRDEYRDCLGRDTWVPGPGVYPSSVGFAFVPGPLLLKATRKATIVEQIDRLLMADVLAREQVVVLPVVYAFADTKAAALPAKMIREARDESKRSGSHYVIVLVPCARFDQSEMHVSVWGVATWKQLEDAQTSSLLEVNRVAHKVHLPYPRWTRADECQSCIRT
jgi:hypothetical protein